MFGAIWNRFSAASVSKGQFLRNLYLLFSYLPSKRQRQLALLLFLQVASAFMEFVSLGSVVPFLSALTDFEKIASNVWLSKIFALLDLEGRASIIAFLTVIFTVSVVMTNFLRIATLWCQSVLSARIGADISRQLFDTLLSRSYLFFKKHNTSEHIGALTNDLNGSLGAIHSVFTIITHGLIALSMILSLLLFDPYAAIFFGLIIGSSYLLIVFAVRRRLYRNSLITSDAYRASIRAMQQGFGSIREIILADKRSIFSNELESKELLFRKTQAENSVIRTAPRYLLESIAISTICIGVLFKSGDSEALTSYIPTIGFFAMVGLRILPAAQQIYNCISSVLGIRSSLERTIKSLSFKAETLESSKPHSFEQGLFLKDVFFRYQDSHWNIKNLSLEIRPNSVVALVGKTGSGKSTLADLILGLIQPEKGDIEIDSDAMPKVLGSWHSKVSSVPQDIYLIDASIAENIAFGVPLPDIDLGLVRRVSRLAKISDYIDSLDNGYFEVVGERGVRMSGGQRQRIGIARALYNSPDLIVFDEATSALDNKTESEVMESINNLSKTTTVVLIAHRLSTIQKADHIILLDNGSIVASGSYEDLLNSCPKFAELINHEQMAG